ncbi:hypothetical protein [Mycoplasma sp. Ms02]|uniref:hypothetical protein n=1 Tax=Mycoplasma sp. Ms02 TaxID=353851 RepID=UPI001C897198|nr:hypothetical protein [Mycoplasma sp. Ms02]QZE12314.1 hypothetical protein K4L35_03205 [Mycoplasma sp. Ms02]
MNKKENERETESAMLNQRVVNDYVSQIIYMSSEEQNLYGSIAEALRKKLKKKIKIGKAVVFCNEISISPSTFTNFSKELGFENVREMIYTHNQIIRDSEPKVVTNESDKTIKSAASLIQNARKIMLIGVSGTLGINHDLNIKLLRMGMNTVFVANKYEQIGLSRILTSDDLIIVNSISLSHKWMTDIIEETEAKVLLISSSLPTKIKHKVTEFFLVETTERHDGMRLYSSDSRLVSTRFIYKVFDELMTNEQNYLNLIKTAYK